MLCINITRSDGSFKHKMSLHRKKLNVIITGRNEVVAKVMFLLVSVILLMGGVLSQHALQVVSQHALQQVSGGCQLWGVPGPGGAWSEGGCLVQGGAWSGESARGGVWPSVMPFCCGLLFCPSVMAFWLKVVFCYGLLV